MWNYLSLTRHADGCKFIRRDGPGFETEGAVCWEVIVQIMDVCEGLENRTERSITYTAWWAQRIRNVLTVSEAGVTFVIYEYAEEAGADAAAMAALEAMFAEHEVDFNFGRIVREPMR